MYVFASNHQESFSVITVYFFNLQGEVCLLQATSTRKDTHVRYLEEYVQITIDVYFYTVGKFCCPHCVVLRWS